MQHGSQHFGIDLTKTKEVHNISSLPRETITEVKPTDQGMAAIANLLRRWRERPIDFWLQLSCGVFFAPARGPYRALGVLLALLQWYQCFFHLYLIHRFWFTAKSMDYWIIAITLTTSQALTFSFAIFYLWQSDFVPFQGCSLPYLNLPNLSGETENGAVHDCEERNGVEKCHDDLEGGGERSYGSFQHSQDGLQVEEACETLEEGGHELDEECTERSRQRRERSSQQNESGVGERTALLQSSINCRPAGERRDLKLWLYYVNSSTGRFEKRLSSHDEKRRFESIHGDTCIKANFFLVVGFAIVIALIVIDLCWDRFFNGRHIRHFLIDCDNSVVAMYIVSTVSFYWGMFAIVTMCCLFYCMTRTMVLAILEAEQVTILPEVSLQKAIDIQENLLAYIHHLTRSMSVWFAVHSISFLVLILASVYWWQYLGTKEHDPHPVRLFLAVCVACMAIAFKFAFPLWAASRVTKEWKRQIVVLNSSRGWSPWRHHDQDVLLNYITRSGSGFVVGGLLVSENFFLLLLVFISSFLALFRNIHIPNPK